MPEIAEAPPAETETQPQEEFGAIPKGLQAILDKHLPTASSETPTEATEAVEAKPEKVVEEKKPEPAKDKKPSLLDRLAPDITEKPAETAPVVDEIPEESPHAKTEKAREDHRKWRKTHVALQEEVKSLRAKVASPAVDTGALAQIEQLTKEKQALAERLERTDLMSSPKFQNEFILPRNKMFEDAQGLLKDAGVDPALLSQALGMNGRARITAMDSILEEIPSQMLKDRFGRLIDGLDAKNRDINEQLKNAHTNLEQMTREEKAAEHAKFLGMEKQILAGLEQCGRDLADKMGIELLHKTGQKNYEWWDKQKDEIDSLAREIATKSTPDKIPIISYYAAMFGPQREMWKSERARAEAAEAENRELKGVEPTLGEDKRASKEIPDDADFKSVILGKLRAGT